MNMIVSIAILILALSVAFLVIGMVAYIYDLDDLFRQICHRIEITTEKAKYKEFDRGRAQGRKEFAAVIDSMLDVCLFGNDIKYTYQVAEKLEKKIAEELRK